MSRIPEPVEQMGFNETDWDRWRNNTQGVLLPSAARTATATSPIVTNYNARALIVYLKVTAASGTGGLSVFIRAVDPASGDKYLLNAAPTAVTAIGKSGYIVALGAGTMQGDIKQITNVPVPKKFEVQISHGDSSSYTYTLGYDLIV